MINFSIAKLPKIIFGSGQIKNLPELISVYGSNVLFVTGQRSFVETQRWQELLTELKVQNINWHHTVVGGEPSPELVDLNVTEYQKTKIDCVVGIGGGSALDAAKAIAGLLRVKQSVMDFLEGVGPELAYPGPSVPLIAIPTTAGTGSEATKNAVLSQHGNEGFKKSFRDELLVADYALIDPDLLATCTPEIIAANGMDALTQLIESYVSLKANNFTDALAISGLRAARDGLLSWYDEPAGSLDDTRKKDAREKMAYAALNSGITLAQVGLGSVHGLASPLGAFYPIPHGVVCGTLVAEATKTNINAMRSREPENVALGKYARLAEIICERRIRSHEEAWSALVATLEQWTQHLDLPRLGQFGLADSGINHVVANSRGSSMKTNPIVLTDQEISQLVSIRI